MKLYKIETGNFKLDGGAMFGVVPKVLWEKQYPADENNQCNLVMRCLLVEDEDRKILIDNGLGEKQDEKFLKNFGLFGDDSLEKSLKSHGFSFEDITDVVLTHLHFDHCGGTIKYDENRNLVPAFPNAKIWSSKQQWELALNPNKREKASYFKENLLPMQESGKLQLFEENMFLTPNVEFRLIHGHTAGQTIVYIDYNGKTVVYTADLLPLVAQIPIAWVMSYDTLPLVTLDEKKALLEEAAEKNQILFFEHDYYTECCTVKMTEKGVRLDKALKFEEII